MTASLAWVHAVAMEPQTDDQRDGDIVWMLLGLAIMVVAVIATIALLIDMSESGEVSYTVVDKWRVVQTGLIGFGVGAITTAVGAIKR